MPPQNHSSGTIEPWQLVLSQLGEMRGDTKDLVDKVEAVRCAIAVNDALNESRTTLIAEIKASADEAHKRIDDCLSRHDGKATRTDVQRIVGAHPSLRRRLYRVGAHSLTAACTTLVLTLADVAKEHFSHHDSRPGISQPAAPEGIK